MPSITAVTKLVSTPMTHPGLSAFRAPRRSALKGQGFMKPFPRLTFSVGNRETMSTTRLPGPSKRICNGQGRKKERKGCHRCLQETKQSANGGKAAEPIGIRQGKQGT